MIRFEEDLGPVQIVDAETATRLSNEGWRLLLIFQEVVPTPVFTSGTDPNTGMVTTGSDYSPQTHTKFVLGRPKDDAILHLQNLVASLESSLKSAKDEHLETKRAYAGRVETIEGQVVALDGQLKEALLACRDFAGEREGLEDNVKRLQALRAVDTKRIQELAEDVRGLKDTSQTVAKLIACEDWITAVQKMLPETVREKLIEACGPFPVKSPKTWAERLTLDED